MSVSSIPGALPYGFRQAGGAGDADVSASEEASGSTASTAAKSADAASDSHPALTDSGTKLSSDLVAVLVQLQTQGDGSAEQATSGITTASAGEAVSPTTSSPSSSSAGASGTGEDDTSGTSSLLGAEFQQLEKALAAYFARTSAGKTGGDTSA